MTKRLVLNLGQLLKKKKRIPSEVPTPEIEPNSSAFILAPGPDDRDLAEMQWANTRQGEMGAVGFRKFIVTWCLCDESNKRLIDSGPREDKITPEFAEAMRTIGENMPLKTLVRLFDQAHKNLGLATEDIEELVKNSRTTRRGGGSGSKPKRRGKAENNGLATLTTPEN